MKNGYLHFPYFTLDRTGTALTNLLKLISATCKLNYIPAKGFKPNSISLHNSKG